MAKDKKKRVAKLANNLLEMLEAMQWHSAIGFNESTVSNQSTKCAMENNEKNFSKFIPAGRRFAYKTASTRVAGEKGELLIHKATRALWKVSDNGRFIEPAFDDDVISIEDEE